MVPANDRLFLREFGPKRLNGEIDSDATQLGPLARQRVQSKMLVVYKLSNLAEANPISHGLKTLLS